MTLINLKEKLIMNNSYKFFENKDCKYFPCHNIDDNSNFNCLFCFCPLYFLDDRCGGNFSYIKGDIKNCSNCILPHKPDYYDVIIDKLKRN